MKSFRDSSVILEKVFICLLIGQILINFFSQLDFYANNSPGCQSHSPGESFLPARSLLRHVLIAGYYFPEYRQVSLTENVTAFTYQQAQYALSPLMLDLNNPFLYQHVFMVCQNEGCYEEAIRHGFHLELKDKGWSLWGRERNL